MCDEQLMASSDRPYTGARNTGDKTRPSAGSIHNTGGANLALIGDHFGNTTALDAKAGNADVWKEQATGFGCRTTYPLGICPGSR